MAFPTIVIDSATGSDTLSSGAGPGDGTTSGSALNGTTNATTDGAGTTVTLPAGTDLSNVDTTGLHAIWFNDTTAGNVNFSRISGKAGSGGATPTVTVATALGATLTKSWAIGGKRASLGSTTSSRLLNNTSNTNGDARGGWIIEFLSGHTETFTFREDIYAAGNTTDGPIIIRTRAGFSSRAALTFNANADWIVRGNGWWHYDIEFIGGSTGISLLLFYLSGITARAERCKFSPTSTCTAVSMASDIRGKVISCEITGGTVGINCTGHHDAIINNYIHGCSSHGIQVNSPTAGGVVYGNVVTGCGGDGINITPGRNDAYDLFLVAHNTCYNNTSDGIEFTAAATGSSTHVFNNILSSNGAYGLRFADADALILENNILIKGNQTYNNTTNAYKSSTSAYAYNTCPWVTDDNNLDPTFTNAGAGDYTIGTNLKAKAFPVGGSEKVGGPAGVIYSYVDPGGAQRVEAGAGTTYEFGGVFPSQIAPARHSSY
jgi:hypothetical protein